MKKKVLASLLCASMVATMFAGCGSGNGGNGTEKADKKDGGKETITVMGPAEDLDDAQGAWLKTECEAFAKANPDFNIEFKYVTSSESDAKDVVTKDPKAAADVYMFANDQLEPLIKANAIAKLGGDTAEYVKSSNSEAMAATVTYDGDIYAVPYTSNTWFMYYDKRVFSEDDVKSLDTMLTKGKVSFPFDNGWYLNAFYAANGCTIFGDGTDKAAGYDFSGDKGTAVTNYIVDYDVLSVSAYPFWFGHASDLASTLKNISVKYNKKVMVAETAYPYTFNNADDTVNNIGSKEDMTYCDYPISVSGQKQAISDIFNAVASVNSIEKTKGYGLGGFYWEPSWIGTSKRISDSCGTGWSSSVSENYENLFVLNGSQYATSAQGSSWDNMTLFDKNGVALQSLQIFNDFKK